MHYVAPVGEKELYIERMMQNITPFLDACPATVRDGARVPGVESRGVQRLLSKAATPAGPGNYRVRAPFTNSSEARNSSISCS